MSILCCRSVSSSCLFWFSFLSFSSSSSSCLIRSMRRRFSLCSARMAFLSSIWTASSSSSAVAGRADFALALPLAAEAGSVKSIKSLFSLSLAASLYASCLRACSLAMRSFARLSSSRSSCCLFFLRASCIILLLSAWSSPRVALPSACRFCRSSFLFSLSSLIYC